jgi:hypothetical protein
MDRSQINSRFVDMMVVAEKIAGEYLCAATHAFDHGINGGFLPSFAQYDMKKAVHYARLTNRIGEWLVEK